MRGIKGRSTVASSLGSAHQCHSITRSIMSSCRGLPSLIMTTGSIACTRKELDLGITLNGGQSFRWVSLENGSRFRGIFRRHVWTLNQDDENLHYILHNSASIDGNACSDVLKKYFNFQISLQNNIDKWKACDSQFEKSCSRATGVRILDQDIVENLFSFICSSNNNIPRISGMVHKMCKHFGKKICRLEKEDQYDFPSIEALSKNEVESILRKEGFGYRAAYVAKTAKRLMELGGRGWLDDLHKSRGASYSESREKLMTLQGIGPKVADCICLMSLGHLEAIPVDTHIFQVARETYMPSLIARKTVTPKIHEEISTHMRKLWGPLAGWAQAVIFCAKIKGEKSLIPRRKQKLEKDIAGKMKSGKKRKKE